MHPWLDFVDLVRASLFMLAHATHGSTGAAILALSVLVRMALLPLSVKVALRGYDSAQRQKALGPEIKRLSERYKNDPARLWTETRALNKQHNVQVFTRLSLFTMMVQMPLGIAVYRVVSENVLRAGRFLFIPDLAQPNVLLTALIATTGALGTLFAPSTAPGKTAAVISSMLITTLIVWRLASGVGLYWLGSSAVGVAQSLIVKRIVARKRPRMR